MNRKYIFSGILIVLVITLISLAWYVGSLKRGEMTNSQAMALQEKTADLSFRPVDNNDFAIGSPAPKITIIEYSDTECPFCIAFHKSLKLALSEFSQDVRWVYRFSPIPQLHKKAVPEAIASYCAGKLKGNDGFWKYINRIYDTTPGNDGLDLLKLDQYAAELGINTAEFEACKNDPASLEYINNDRKDALAAGLQGTPHSIVVGENGELIDAVQGYVPYDQLKTRIGAWIQIANENK